MRPEVGCLGVNAEFVYLVSSSGFLAVLIIMLLVPKKLMLESIRPGSRLAKLTSAWHACRQSRCRLIVDTPYVPKSRHAPLIIPPGLSVVHREISKVDFVEIFHLY